MRPISTGVQKRTVELAVPELVDLVLLEAEEVTDLVEDGDADLAP
jgi:ATP phosphoribosyltransferase